MSPSLLLDQCKDSTVNMRVYVKVVASIHRNKTVELSENLRMSCMWLRPFFFKLVCHKILE